MDAIAFLTQSEILLPGAGLPKIIANMLLGRNGERAEEFLADNPEARLLVHRALHSPATNSGRVQACHARARLAALYCPLPGTQHYYDKYYAPPPQRICNWCQELYQPRRGSGYGNQIYCSRACNQRRYRYFKREREQVQNGHISTPKDAADRMWASVERCRKQTAERRRGDTAKDQAQMGLPDW